MATKQKKKAVAGPKRNARSRESRCNYVVGIGASAGGLEALRALFAPIKTRPNMAFVVVQHLAPQHRSRLVELIASTTQLAVAEVQDGQVPEPGVIYITPPNANILSEDGVLRLKGTQFGPKPSIDLFLRSLAADIGPRAIGIVLSGTGSDGAMGVRAIKASGGLTLAQSAASSKYDGMPKAALQTGAVDLALSPGEIAEELRRIDTGGPARRKSKRRLLPAGDPFEGIMRLLERQVGVDFFKYKQTTIRRRLDRRLVATGCETLEEYASYLDDMPGEAQNLLQNILISVTSFFRDADAFKLLGQHVAARIKARKDGTHFRCWVVGCATGEEAYSLAILISEAMEKSGKNLRLQMFATDLDEQALGIARHATYSEQQIAGIPVKLRDKYFTALDGGFQVRASLRDCIIFAKHNATEDPPFLNLDLASCRNVLIYFNSKLQEKLFATLQYALARDGLLFLGKSEAVPHGSTAFKIEHGRHKLYRRLGARGEIPRASTRQEIHREAALVTRDRDAGQAVDLFHAVVAGLAPDSIIVDGELYIKHVFGRAGELLVHPPGQVTQSLTRLVPAEMAMELAALMHKAERNGAAATGRRHETEMKKHIRSVQLSVVPLSPAGSKGDYLVCFHTTVAAKVASKGRRAHAPASAEERVARLESDLAAAREHLQTVVEEQATSNEEMQSLNEELQSSNEELQSSNEELETTNEELQSANEELTTVNEELNVKSAELQSMNQRLQAIQSAIVYPLLVIDRGRRLLNFNPAARHLFRLSDTDLGSDVRSIGELGEARDVARLIDEAFSRKSEPRLQLTIRERSFEMQLQLFRGARDVIEGAVASFVENSEIVRALEESRLNRQRLSSILESTPAVVTMKDLNGIYLYANRRFCEMLGRPQSDIVGHTDEELFGHDAAAPLQEHDYEVIKKKRLIEVTETYLVGGASRTWNSSKYPLYDNKKRVQSVCTVSLDMTERIAYEEQLDLFKRATSASNNGILILEPHAGSCRVSFASDPVAGLTGTPHHRLVGLELAEVLQKLKLRHKAGLEGMVAQILSDPECSFTLAMGKAPAEECWYEMRSCRVQLKEEPTGVRHVILTFLDVTDRVRDARLIEAQQEELGRVTRFSALNEIAAGIAHEVNTPLSVIMTKTGILKTLARQKKIELPETNAIADDIAKMAKSVSEIVHGLASVVSRNVDRLESASLKQIVCDAAKMCESRISRIGAELRLDLCDDDVPVECYPVQIMQIMVNLFNNAIDAISERRERWIAVRVRADESRAEITVTDSGPGISSSVAEKVFTPFFTTKQDREGTGIGLSLSRSIARRHDGELVLDMAHEHTCFRLVMPRQQTGRVIEFERRSAAGTAA